MSRPKRLIACARRNERLNLDGNHPPCFAHPPSPPSPRSPRRPPQPSRRGRAVEQTLAAKNYGVKRATVLNNKDLIDDRGHVPRATDGNDYYVYTVTRYNGDVVYVGKGRGPRASRDFTGPGQNQHLAVIIERDHAAGHRETVAAEGPVRRTRDV
jgi:hypothetical protein